MTLLMRDRENIEKGREEGLLEGLQKGRQAGLIELVRDGLLTIAECAKRIGLSEAEVKKLL